VTTRTSYNTFGEPAADSTWVGSALVFARTYTRDDLGRITEVVDFADSVTTIWGYGYDEIGRLETVTQDSVAYASYGYDANGNRLSRTSGAGTEIGTYDAQDRLLTYDGATYSYTPAGELLEKVEGTDTTRYDYDALGNLIEVELPDGTLIGYVIDGRNRRVGRKVDGQLVQAWLYGDQLNPVAELDSLGNVVSRFVCGSKANVPDYIVQGSDTLRVVSDHLGSVRMVVNASTGAVAQRVSYDAWGRVLEDTNPGFQPFGFAGGMWDPPRGWCDSGRGTTTRWRGGGRQRIPLGSAGTTRTSMRIRWVIRSTSLISMAPQRLTISTTSPLVSAMPCSSDSATSFVRCWESLALRSARAGTVLERGRASELELPDSLTRRPRRVLLGRPPQALRRVPAERL
jgi:YD repeat-containing protein